MGGSRSGHSSEPEPRGGRKLVERVLRETVRRVVETGVEKIAEGPENLRNFVSEMKLPKDIAGYLLLQIDETKAGVYRVVANEIRTFLERTNLAEQLTQALGSLALEIKTEIRFVPVSDERDGVVRTQPHVKTSVRFPSSDETAESGGSTASDAPVAPVAPVHVGLDDEGTDDVDGPQFSANSSRSDRPFEPQDTADAKEPTPPRGTRL